MAGKSPDKLWKTTGYTMSGQLKTLENEQADLLKTFDGHLTDVKIHLAEKKQIPVEKAYQCFFETYDDLKDNRKQQRQLLKPKYLESFDGDTERKLGEKKQTLKWLVEQIPNLRKIEDYRNCVFIPRKDTLRLYTMAENVNRFIEKQRKWKRRWDQKI